MNAKKTATWLSICLGCTAAAEGVRQTAYWDPYGKVATVCFGETKGVKLGDKYTMDQCEQMLATSLLQYGADVDKCTTVKLPATRKAAMADFAYNVGPSVYCTRVAPLLNQGKVQEACDKLTLYVYAGGIKLPGLVKRRENERKLCLASAPLQKDLSSMEWLPLSLPEFS